jgi:hypothetical protein
METRHIDKSQRSDDLESHVLTINASECDQNPSTDFRNLSFQPSISEELSSQQYILGPKKEPSVMLSAPVQVFVCTEILIQYDVGIIVVALSIIIDEEKLGSGLLDGSLIVGAELVSVCYDPIGIKPAREVLGFDGIFNASRLRIQ